MYATILVFCFLNLNLQKDWYKVETKHFVIYYHKEIEDFARRSAEFLENIYPKMTSLLRFKAPNKIKIVLGDFDDIGNGLALEIFDQVFVFTADIYFIPFRGRHPWLEDVLVHELTHILALKKIKKMPDTVPSVYLSGGIFCVLDPICKIGNVEKKSTLIGGFILGTVPYSEPAYFTEGIAQLVTAELGYDALDSYREMIIRTLFYHDKIYPFEKLGNFEDKAGFEGEIVYNHGFSLLTFIKEKYGWDAILKVMDYSSGFFNFSYEKAFEKATGKNFKEIQEEWKQWLKQKYTPFIERYEQKKKFGEKIEVKNKRVGLYTPKVYFVYQPRPYKDGILLIQDRNLVFYRGSEPQVIAGGVQSYSVQGTQIVIAYPKPTKKFIFLASFPEVYLNLATGYIVEEEKDGEKKIVIKERKDVAKRAAYPSFSPDGKKIVFTRNEIDSRNLFIYDIESGKERRITNFKNGKQFMFPQFSPDGDYIVAAYFDGKNQYIVALEYDNVVYSESQLKFITKDKAEARDPVFINRNMISFSSDRDGVFNIYVKEIDSGRVWKLTEEISGCIFPYPVSEEEFLYVSFETEGFRPKRIIAKKETWEEINEQQRDKEEEEKRDKDKEEEKRDRERYREEKLAQIPDISRSNDLSIDPINKNHQGFTSKQDISEENIKISEKQQSDTDTVWGSFGEKVGIVELSKPLFIPSIGLTLTPLLTSSSTDFFIPLDIFGVSVEGFTFDVLGRTQIGFSGSLGLRGSFGLVGQIDSFHFEYFIPSLIVGLSRYRATPITNIQELDLSSEGWTITRLFGALPFRFPIIYGVQGGRSLSILLAPAAEYYKQEVKTGGLTYLPFGQSYSATSFRGIFGTGFVQPFRIPIGSISILTELIISSFQTSAKVKLEQFAETLDEISENYFSANSVFSLGTQYVLPIGFEKSFSIFSIGRIGYTLNNVSSIDEFADTYLGYLQVFFGDAFFEWTSGTLIDIWSGYLNITQTSALHRISFAGLYNLFRFVRQFDETKKPVNLNEIFRGRYFSSLSLGLVTYASIFYRYNLVFQILVSRGFQDPLKAPFRMYFGIGIGI
ncbi:MAG: hypothetical protein NZ927_00590 [Candidatus Calescibacterium sp.]|nr:hypothetical protein [Candidatus Calescibacterium sp.]MCX7733866.1 hypothetical protein [bacterium]